VIDMSQTLRLVTYNQQRGIQYEQIRHHLDTVPRLRQAALLHRWDSADSRLLRSALINS